MYYIGINISKFNHCACVISSEGEVIIEPFFFPNNLDDFESFIKTVKKLKSSRHIVDLRTTGHYGDNLTIFLVKHDFEVGLINPLTTDAKRKSKIRKTKNDKKDTFLIYSVLFDRDYTRGTQRKLDIKQARELTRYHTSITEDINQKKKCLQKCINIAIPEFNSWFKTKYSKA